MPTPSLPPRVVLSPLPTLYVYDHCPFCVRVRHLLGLKNIKYNLVFLANDDVTTPTALVGRKVVPIFQPQGTGGPAQPESLDICKHVDNDPRFGAPGLLKSATPRDDIAKWMDELAMPMRRLSRVRFSRAPLPEFVFQEARETYIRNHPLSDPGDYEDNFDRSTEYITQVQERLDELAEMIYSPEHCSPHGLSYDDIVLFPRLRTLTIVKGLVLPKRLREYVEFQAAAAEIPVYDYCAI
ncbi:Glutaredoxin 2 [Gracilariopsis chorda]|uniref:Glutaredoxin 2 n=1 Tax=Gracilariopsis chorda TaxID=448386 RepID=A0A2V3IFN8_9FLOR|nr:Glutaredoxin 2 [Gracilariopsis chorda]|eukprot:PXF39990.1 Glutaredoxin 2 [Gracilariopsis chorda]